MGYAIVVLWLLLVHHHEGGSVVVCPSKLLYGLSCPACGVTRATLLFFHGDIIAALRLNPNVVLAVSGIILFPPLMIYDRCCRPGLLLMLYNKLERLLSIKILLFLLLAVEFCIGVWNNLHHL